MILKKFKGREGFTFNELMVVLFLLGIVALLAVPNIGRWIATSKLKSATRTTGAYLKIARIRAVSQNKRFEALVDKATDPKDGKMKTHLTVYSKDKVGNKTISEENFMDPDITIDVVPAPGNPMIFLANGIVKFPVTNPATTKITITIKKRAGQAREQSQILTLYIAGSLKEEKVGNL
jgi:prepilin-type N-terminal cleavage/methylation domain-containing protein